MKIKSFLKPYMPYVLLAPLSMVIEVVMDLMQPRLMAAVVNDGVLGGDIRIIVSKSLQMIVISLIGLAGGFGCTYFSSIASVSFGTDLRGALFGKTQALSFGQTDRFGTGSLVTRLTNDVMQLQTMVLMSLRMFVRAPLLSIGGIIMALSINVKYGLVLVVIIPIVAAVILFMLIKASGIFSVIQKKLDKLNAILQENLKGIRVVKAYVRAKQEKKRFGDANDDMTGTLMKMMRLMALINPIMMVVMNAAVIAVIYMGALQVQAAQARIGDVLAGITYITQVLMSIMMMSMLFMMISRAKASSVRIREVLETAPAIVSGNSDAVVTAGAISLRDVSFAYPDSSGEPVLDHIDLDIMPGEHVAVLGSTGAGKTSLVSLIPRFYDVTSGSVLVDGTDVRDYDLDRLRAGISFVLQETLLFTGTILENIKWGKPDASDDGAADAAKWAQADDFITGFTEGYATELGQGGLTLSGGQKQRVSIARALIKKPKILILDDSTSALDTGTEARLQRAIRENFKGTTCLTIAQRISSVMYADRIVVLDGGRIADIGTHGQLLQSSAVYRDIYDSQSGQGGVVA